MGVPNFMSIQPIDIEILQSGSKWWIEPPTLSALLNYNAIGAAHQCVKSPTKPSPFRLSRPPKVQTLQLLNPSSPSRSSRKPALYSWPDN